jgi:carbonic anhydrase/acetyltransferase-like protein (isoleucine patch superfamily)
MTATELEIAQKTPTTQLDAIPVTKIRKKRAPKHDFKDGYGRVFAHRHDNGRGWVADTASVDDSVYVGSRAQVFQHAKVLGRCRLEGQAKVHGFATVRGAVIVKHSAQIYGRSTVCDGTLLHDNSSITGSAIVCGNSSLYNVANISESAYVLGSTLRNNAVIRGTACVLRSMFHGPVMVGGTASVISSTLHGNISVLDFAQILHSAIDTSNHPTYGGIRIRDFVVIADRSRVWMNNADIHSHAVLIQTSITATDNNVANQIRIGDSIALYHETFQSSTPLLSALNEFTTQRALGNRNGLSRVGMVQDNTNEPPTMTRIPVAVAIGPRRVMRLPEAIT